jgi:hypothetical protein
MDLQKNPYRELPRPVGPNRLSRLTEVAIAVVFVLVAVYLTS